MSKEEVERLTYDLRSEFTDAGHYSYAGLCAYCLWRLYGNSKWDKDYTAKCLKSVVDHLGHDKQFEGSMKAISSGEAGLEDADPFVLTLCEEKSIKDHGPEIVPQDFIMLTLKEGHYDSRMRTVSKYISLLLKVDWEKMATFEDLVLESFKEEEHELTEEEVKERDKAKKKQTIKRYALIGLATVGGGTLIGLTGGLAAPLIAAGAGAVIGASGAAALGSVAGVAIIGSLFGVAGAGLGAYKMKKRVGSIEEFEFEPLSEGRQLTLTIAVSGWLTKESSDFKTAWRGLDNCKEQYVLKYESKYLQQMGESLDYLFSIAMTAAAQETLKYTVLSGLLAAIAWPATILSAANVIDNPWSVCTQRTVNAGKQLAEVLLSRQQGKRPVTLIGFSLGARVIFYCLQEMAKRKNCEGIVEEVILLGTPCTGNPSEWEPLSRVVAGRIVNGYCRGDWLLKFLYRTASIQFTVAGLAPVKWDNRRMHNIDLSDVISGHLDYMMKIDEILNVVGIKTKEHAKGNTGETLKQWVGIQKSRSSNLSSTKSSQSSSRVGSVKSSPAGSPSHQVKQPPTADSCDVDTPNQGTDPTNIDSMLDTNEKMKSENTLVDKMPGETVEDEKIMREVASKIVEEVISSVVVEEQITSLDVGEQSLDQKCNEAREAQPPDTTTPPLQDVKQKSAEPPSTLRDNTIQSTQSHVVNEGEISTNEDVSTPDSGISLPACSGAPSPTTTTNSFDEGKVE